MANKIIDSMTYGSDTYTISTPYGTCSTAADTAAKDVTCANFVALETGAKVTVHFTYANSAANPTLNVNSKGAKYILYRNSKLDTSAEYWKANDIITFVYDAAWSSNTGAWRLEGHLDTDTNSNTTYTIATGNSNGQIKVTPSSGSAYNVAVKGLGSSAFVTNYKAAECTSYTSDEGNCTPAAINKAITQGIFPASSSAYGTIKVSSINSSAVTVNSESSTAGRYYPVELNSDGKAIVNVPWVDTNTNTTYSAGTGLQLSGTTFSAKLNSTSSLGTIGTTSRLYAVGVDVNGKLAVNVPWTDTNTHDGNDNQKVSAGDTTFGINDTVKFVAGSNVTITPNATNKTITISSTDTNTDTNTSHSHTAGVGLVGSGSAGTGSGTYNYKAKLKSETALTIDSSAATTTSGRVYPVAVDKSGYLAVNVPWTDTNTDTNTTYSAGTGLSLSGTTFNVNTGYTTNGKNYKVQADSSGNLFVNVPWTDTNTDTNTTYSAGTGLSLSGTTFSVKTGYTTSGKNYKVQADTDGNLFVNVPWTDTNTNTTYSAGTGISLSGTTFSNSGVRSISTGSANGTISVNTNGTTADVAVKGLGSAAYKATSYFAEASHSHTSVNGYTISVITQSAWNSLSSKSASTIYFITA